ncbi:MAG: restriction endonuclease subunit S [bacterium]|nr:restriction endonuclease subunit S [bacterium]
MSAVLSIEATINQHMASITPKPQRVSSRYLHMYLTAAYSELRAISSASGSTKAALTCEDIKRFKVVLPPIDEQQQLLSYVSREFARVADAINRAHRQIELVQEYCTRLVADVVTGKLDVREAAAQLP